MARRSLAWKMIPLHLGIVLTAVLVLTSYTHHAVRTFQVERIEDDLRARANLIAGRVMTLLDAHEYGELDHFCRNAGRLSDTRITVILPDGRVVADSHEAAELMDNHAQRPEVVRALRGEWGTAIRPSHTLQKNMMYAAVPVIREGRSAAIVRLALPLTAVEGMLADFSSRILAGGGIVALVAALAGVALARSLSRPIEQMRAGAGRLAGGDFRSRLPVPDVEELAQLAESLNAMAGQLEDKLDTIRRQHNELQGVLTSMTEGVIALNAQEQVLSMNRAAGALLDVDAGATAGRGILEIVRDVRLRELIGRTLSRNASVEESIALGNGRHIHAHGSRLEDPAGAVMGALLVLHDITRLHQLETMRRDFVANVSHELKTPLTSIRGYVETLRDGALEDPENARRFLDVIARHTERLCLIIDDLLSLSRLEQEEETGAIALEPHRVTEVVGAAVESCNPAAREKGIVLRGPDDAPVRARVNAHLLEQAVFNLIDNAIKYSGAGTSVTVAVGEHGGNVTIAVSDEGRGIAPEHLPRIFERFYRVDKARSGANAGTGLGLSLVKHICAVHGGRVDVRSALGKGSCFTLHLPAV